MRLSQQQLLSSVLALLSVVAAQPTQELIITYSNKVSRKCNNPLDHARILVAAADFLTGVEETRGTSEVAPQTCDKIYTPCKAAHGGGCCKNLKCAVTSNGLERCVAKSYQAKCARNNAICTRGQPCCNGLTCQNHRTRRGHKQCRPTPKPKKRQLREVDVTADQDASSEENTAIVDEHVSRKLQSGYNRAWGCSGRTCNRCPKDQSRKSFFCNGLCLFQCSSPRRQRQLMGNSMGEFLDALKKYMVTLDFGDDCDVNELTFGYFVGTPGKTIA